RKKSKLGEAAFAAEGGFAGPEKEGACGGTTVSPAPYAEGGNRTHTGFRPPDFESGASTNSATSAHRNSSPRSPARPLSETRRGRSRGEPGVHRSQKALKAGPRAWILCRHGAVTASGHRRGTEEDLVRKRPFLGLFLVAVAALALIASGCGSKKSSSSNNNTSSSSSGGSVTAPPASSCQGIYYQGSGKP